MTTGPSSCRSRLEARLDAIENVLTAVVVPALQRLEQRLSASPEKGRGDSDGADNSDDTSSERTHSHAFRDPARSSLFFFSHASYFLRCFWSVFFFSARSVIIRRRGRFLCSNLHHLHETPARFRLPVFTAGAESPPLRRAAQVASWDAGSWAPGGGQWADSCSSMGYGLEEAEKAASGPP